MAKIAEQHHTETHMFRRWKDGKPLGVEYEARCSCGYTGRPMPTRADAEDDADEHVRQMIDPSDRIR